MKSKSKRKLGNVMQIVACLTVITGVILAIMITNVWLFLTMVVGGIGLFGAGTWLYFADYREQPFKGTFYNREQVQMQTGRNMTYFCLTIILMLLVLASGCSTQGYGCKGKSKIITRVKQ